MAQKTINLGTGELAGDGETLRSAFSKANDNFTELYNTDAGDFDGAFASLTGKPTTIAGYGITDSPSDLTDLSIVDGTNGQVLTTDGAGNFTFDTVSGGGGGGLTDLLDDLTPQLGGNLDMNGFEIVTTAGGHIRLDPDTTGGVGIGNVTNPSTLLHLQQSEPIITLQRLDNTLSHGISWTGQGGTEAAHIKLDGTGGLTNTLIMSAFDGATVTERLRIMSNSGEGIRVTGSIDAQTFDITTTGKILYANMYATEGDLPNATTYHGMFAHVHATGAGYFAHGGNWIKLANYTDLSAYQTTGTLGTNIDLHLNQASAGASEVLSWDGADYAWVAQSGDGSQNLFSTVASSGQNDIVADGTTDKLYIEAGTGISIATDENTDTLTITATGGSSNSISQLNTNVTVTDTGSDGTITFDTDGTDRWSFTSAGHLMPATNANYDIGSASNKVRHLFLSDNSLKFVDAGDVEYSLGVVGTKLQYQGEDIIQATSTDNVNMNVSGAGLGISIGTASTSGSTISIGAEVNNTSINMYGVTEFGAKAIFNRGVHEKFLTLTGATGTVDHNTMNGHVFLHTTPAADWTANFTNLDLAQEDGTNIAIVIDQGNTAYIPSAVEIGGVAQTIVWNGNSAPSGTANGKDVVSFTIMNDGGTYMVLGQLVSFGGV